MIINNLTQKDEINLIKDVTRKQLLKYPKNNIRNFKYIVKQTLKILIGTYKKTDKYFWPNGLLAIGLMYSHIKTEDLNDFEILEKYFDRWRYCRWSMRYLDNAINGYSLIYVFEQTKNQKYKRGLDKIAKYLLNHSTDKYGTLPYRTQTPDLIYIDSLGMICPFLSKYSKFTGEIKWIDIAVTQIKNFLKMGMDSKMGLPYHGYNSKTNSKLGIIGWGRGIGWILIAFVGTLEFLDQSHKEYIYIRDEFVKLINKVLEYQLENGYFTWQLNSIEGPVDTSATSMIAFSLIIGIKTRILNESYKPALKKSLKALLNSTHDGFVNDCSAECMGFSMYPQIYGNYPWSQGLTLAVLTMEY